VAATGLQRTNPDVGPGVTVHITEYGSDNYALVRHEWATAVSTAADRDTTNLDAAPRPTTRRGSQPGQHPTLGHEPATDD
jgi:hypothetical protein